MMKVDLVVENTTAYVCIKNGKNNIISIDVIRELQSCIDLLTQNENVLFVVFHSGRVINGECSGYFSTGADIREMATLDMNTAKHYSVLGQSLMRSIRCLNKVTIAAIPSGFCVGGGLELSMSCKYRVASFGTFFQMPEKKLDIIPGWTGTQTLPYHIGAKEAERWIECGGKSVRTRKAIAIGLIDYVIGNPLGWVSSVIKNGEPFVSRSKQSSDKIILNGTRIETDEDESVLFSECWKNGVPEGIKVFLFESKK
jgi:enoyl-CoA hydratase/carnithine racemase